MYDQYEIHLTILGHPGENKRIVEAMSRWHFSMIDGDPVLGPGLKQYATAHFEFPDGDMVDSFLPAKTEALRMQKFLEENEVNVIRVKIEKIMFDYKVPQEAV